MLKNKRSVFFRKNIKSISNSINLFEKNYVKLIEENKNYKLPKIYNWDFITDKYLDVFFNVTNFQNK